MRRSLLAFVAALLVLAPAVGADTAIKAYSLPSGGGPHDVAVGADGIVWYTAQRSGQLGRLDPATGKVELTPLGAGAAPHGVIIGPDGAPWVTDGGSNAIVRVDPQTREVKRWPLPEARGYANLNTLTFDKRGRVWFTGQNGVYGRLDPRTGAMQVCIARVDLDTGAATVIEPPTKDQGARRVWSDSKGRIWVSEWNAGNVSCYDPRAGTWKTWRLPGEHPRAYAVYVDDKDNVWLSDWGANAMVRFDPATERFEAFPSDRRGANVRQILGRPGEVWAPESGTDRLVVYRTK